MFGLCYYQVYRLGFGSRDGCDVNKLELTKGKEQYFVRHGWSHWVCVCVRCVVCFETLILAVQAYN